MPDEKGNLYIFEGIGLRDEFDGHIKLLERLLEGERAKRDCMFHMGDNEEREPAMEESLKKLQTKRVKLNQAIQVANFQYQIEYRGEEISVAEALELRKNILSDLEALSDRVVKSAYTRVIHKEERDIVHKPRRPFKDSYEEYRKVLRRFRGLVTRIHKTNHTGVVKFKDE